MILRHALTALFISTALVPSIARSDSFTDFMSLCEARPETIDDANQFMAKLGWSPVESGELQSAVDLEYEMKSLRSVFEIGREREMLLKVPYIIENTSGNYSSIQKVLQLVTKFILEDRGTSKSKFEVYTSKEKTSFISYSRFDGCAFRTISGFDDQTLRQSFQDSTEKMGTDKWVHKYVGNIQTSGGEVMEIVAGFFSNETKEIARKLGFSVVAEIQINAPLSSKPLSLPLFQYPLGK